MIPRDGDVIELRSPRTRALLRFTWRELTPEHIALIRKRIGLHAFLQPSGALPPDATEQLRAFVSSSASPGQPGFPPALDETSFLPDAGDEQQQQGMPASGFSSNASR